VADKYRGFFSEAVHHYWALRLKNAGGSAGEYGGRRSEVVGGKQLDGFLETMTGELVGHGVPLEWIHWKGQPQTTIPGWFRASKMWDLLVIDPHDGRPQLLLALELKVLGGPSYGNNANNRAEEAIGNAVDLWTAYREGAYLDGPEPCVAYLLMVEDSAGARSPVKVRERHFPIDEAFRDASYVKRMTLLAHRLMGERHYQAVCVLASKTPVVVEAAAAAVEGVGTEVDPTQAAALAASAEAARAQEVDHGNYTVPDSVVGVDRFVETILARVRPR